MCCKKGCIETKCGAWPPGSSIPCARQLGRGRRQQRPIWVPSALPDEGGRGEPRPYPIRFKTGGETPPLPNIYAGVSLASSFTTSSSGYTVSHLRHCAFCLFAITRVPPQLGHGAGSGRFQEVNSQAG